MAVAFLCNMNNHFFSTVRYLRDLGVDAHILLLNNESPHCHPSYDTFGLGYQRYTHRLDWGEHLKLASVDPRAIRADVVRYRFTVGCGGVPAHFHYAGMRLDLFTAHGSDIAEMPFFVLAPPRRHAISSLWKFPWHQRRGIVDARYIAGPLAPQIEPLYDKIGCKGQRLLSAMPPLYAREFNPDSIADLYDRSTWYHEFKKLRDRSDVIIFHHARHIWSAGMPALAHKGNDKLIRAFARFVAAHRDVTPTLILFEYGPNVNASAQLIRDLGIQQNVAWFPLMARKEIMIGTSLADIVCGEFAVSWNFGGTILEGVAMAKPLLHYRDDAIYPKDELFPIMNVFTEDDIFRALSDYVVRPEHHKAQARIAHTWFDEFVIKRPLERIVELIHADA